MLVTGKTMKAKYQSLFISALLLLTTACASQNAMVKVKNKQDFEGIKTFFVQQPLNEMHPGLQNHLESRIVQQLTQRGLKPSTQENADVTVEYASSFSTRADINAPQIGTGFGDYGRSGGISMGGIYSFPIAQRDLYYQGLVIDIEKDGHFVYSAGASIELEAQDTISVQARLNKLVDKLLEEYPSL